MYPSSSEPAQPAVPLAARVLTLLFAVTAAAPFPGSGPVVFAVALLAVGYAALVGPLRRPSLALTGFIAWCAVTVAWSVAPGQTVRGVLITAATSLALCSLAARLPRLTVVRALATALQLLIGLGWVMYLALPAVGTEQEAYHSGAWTGLFAQRNNAAFVLALAALTFLFLALSPEAPGRGSSLAWTAVALITLTAAESGTGLAVTTVCALLMLAVTHARHWSRSAKGLALGVLGAAAAAVALNVAATVEFVTGLLGRDDTLTGRTVIWAAVEPYIAARPDVGYGWQALWTPDSVETRAMWATAHFDFPHAHNSYLDALAQTGIVGLVLLLLAVLGVLVTAGRALLRGEDGSLPAWPAVITICLLLYGISEQSFLGYFGLLLVVTAAVLARPTAVERTAAGEPAQGAVPVG
ncbi:O-antigen ligase [Blastococcus sp. URHD0036]|uniref:O-antigen ligase family protein n=1 Tax=Blastococcus sp. URHD0036 TaxID=1380356 RepID=UPI000497F180|nr:O-antigen ligase family protein [Blastococcus sp. URHD0036]